MTAPVPPGAPGNPNTVAVAPAVASAMTSSSGKLRIIFMGTPDFALASLKRLIDDRQHILAVVTAPDKPAGRGREMHASPVKVYARAAGIEVLQPANLKDPLFIERLKWLDPDLQVVVAFRMLPEAVWRIARIGTINLHASLLPQYRGAAPINWAIINGEEKTGLTTFFINQDIDTGEILMQQEVDIDPEEDAGSLHDRMKENGAVLLLKTVNAIAAGHYTVQPQSAMPDKGVLKPAPKINKEDCRISWASPASDIVNLIRGLSPYPAAWSTLTGEDKVFPVKIFRSEAIMENHSLSFGMIVTDGRTTLKVAAGDGFVNVNELQLAGKKRLQAEEFLKGFQRMGNYRFE